MGSQNATSSAAGLLALRRLRNGYPTDWVDPKLRNVEPS